MRTDRQRPAIAMIELIFSIVIMGLVLLSAPMLISTATKSTTVALQQEGINEVASRINMILTYEWDENDASSLCAAFPSILRVTNGDDELEAVAATGLPLMVHPHDQDLMDVIEQRYWQREDFSPQAYAKAYRESDGIIWDTAIATLVLRDPLFLCGRTDLRESLVGVGQLRPQRVHLLVRRLDGAVDADGQLLVLLHHLPELALRVLQQAAD